MATGMIQILKKLFFTVIAPAYCVHCQTFLSDDDFLCDHCRGMIMPLATKTISITKKYSAKVFAISDYTDPLKRLVVAKHGGNRLAAKQLGILMWQRTDLQFAEFDIIVPVPLHWTRAVWRWFNQAEIIAQELSKKSGKPVVHLLNRTRPTGYQTRLTRNKRVKNLDGAFSLINKADNYKGKKILLVDDVMTTGTTLYHCARALVRTAPANVIIGVACRTT